MNELAGQLENVTLPVIDMAPLFTERSDGRAEVAARIQLACRESGFFYIAGHGISPQLLENLERVSHAFFALPLERKMAIAMAKGGHAWRGFFAVGGELTSGEPDIKEGLYFGSELAATHPRVQAGWPLHGANLWPAEVPELQELVTGYMTETTRAAAALLEGIALSLNLEAGYFRSHYTADPTVLFRIFHYPVPDKATPASAWGVGEHTDYGLLTLLAQDRHGGLQVKTPSGWIDAPPVPGTLVCNIGDMLDRLTGGWFRSTPHRVRNVSGQGRLSFPLFFDPDFTAEMRALPKQAAQSDVGESSTVRWDGADLQAFEGTYGDYLLGKVSKVFPELSSGVLPKAK
ncbi:isopenicillin N synthase family dioxygenase [Denitrobaculum tricleocarpae]|uniref:2-oxoglutarate-dependent ethylene/succinate-forming enzyme n=1 Tax=Denitrobaculum tricleocarpae TaxID=2591009 RepID=A0A545TT50_9PROT|nr:2-oxoglutarate and iron-dependent oxygenase domain-containing protein [Denitrobaculum tricleocarpae]TQV80393.1 isopenicillin N synthase family oxygenase [Denitrobaculum tricleocarpae]